MSSTTEIRFRWFSSHLPRETTSHKFKKNAFFKGSKPPGKPHARHPSPCIAEQTSALGPLHCILQGGPLHPLLCDWSQNHRLSITQTTFTPCFCLHPPLRRFTDCVSHYTVRSIVRKDTWPPPRPSHIRKFCSLQRLLCKAKGVRK